MSHVSIPENGFVLNSTASAPEAPARLRNVRFSALADYHVAATDGVRIGYAERGGTARSQGVRPMTGRGGGCRAGPVSGKGGRRTGAPTPRVRTQPAPSPWPSVPATTPTRADASTPGSNSPNLGLSPDGVSRVTVQLDMESAFELEG